MDINNLLNQFFAGQANNHAANQQEDNQPNQNTWTDSAKNIAQQATQGGLGGFVGGAVSGGLLSLLLTSKKARNIAGGALGYGGAAALGAMALKAYQNYQAGKENGSTAINAQQNTSSATPQALPNGMATSNNSFGVMLIKSMVMASKVDGHVDAVEQQRIFSALEKSSLSAEEKGIILDALSKPINLQEITINTYTPEQAAQIYLASRIAIDPDQPAEKEFLTSLATGLRLPAELVTQLEKQVTQHA